MFSICRKACRDNGFHPVLAYDLRIPIVLAAQQPVEFLLEAIHVAERQADRSAGGLVLRVADSNFFNEG